MTAAQHVAEAIREAEAALSALSRFQPTHKAPEPGAANDPGCASCRRVQNHRGAPFHSDTERLPGGGHRTLCDWCRRQASMWEDEWRTEHPNQPLPAPTRFWPPKVAVEWWRDNQGKRTTPTLWAEWRMAKRAEKKGKRKAS